MNLLPNRSEKSLTFGLSKNGGRDSAGRISVRRRGGGHKRSYRVIDFKRDKSGVPGTVKTIEYDPNRSANIALVFSYADGEKRYILAPKGIAIGARIVSGPESASRNWECSSFGRRIRSDSRYTMLSFQLGQGGQLVRSAGLGATIVAKEGDYVTIKLPSGEMRMVFGECKATLGSLGNEDHMNVDIGQGGDVTDGWASGLRCEV